VISRGTAISPSSAGACRGAIHEDKTIICEMRAIASPVEIDHPRRLGVVYVIEQQRLSGRAVLGKHAKIGPVAVERRARREAFALVLDGVGGQVANVPSR
jgi:hypothetical protein